MQVTQGVYSSPFRAFLSAILTKHYLIRPKVLDPAPSLIFLGIRMPTYSCVFYLLFNGGKLQVCFTLSPNSLIVSPSSSFLKTCLYQFLNLSLDPITIKYHGCHCFVSYVIHVQWFPVSPRRDRVYFTVLRIELLAGRHNGTIRHDKNINLPRKNA